MISRAQNRSLTSACHAPAPCAPFQKFQALAKNLERAPAFTLDCRSLLASAGLQLQPWRWPHSPCSARWCALAAFLLCNCCCSPCSPLSPLASLNRFPLAPAFRFRWLLVERASLPPCFGWGRGVRVPAPKTRLLPGSKQHLDSPSGGGGSDDEDGNDNASARASRRGASGGNGRDDSASGGTGVRWLPWWCLCLVRFKW